MRGARAGGVYGTGAKAGDRRWKRGARAMKGEGQGQGVEYGTGARAGGRRRDRYQGRGQEN